MMLENKDINRAKQETAVRVLYQWNRVGESAVNLVR